MSGLKSSLSWETFKLFGENREIFNTVLNLYEDTGLSFKAKDPETRTEAKVLKDGNVAITYVIVLDNNPAASDGRIYLKDTFVFDPQEKKFQKFSRDFEFDGQPKDPDRWKEWLNKYKEAGQPTQEQISRFANIVARSYSRPFYSIPDFFKNLDEGDRDYINSIAWLAGEVHPSLGLKIRDKGSFYSIIDRGRKIEIVTSLVIDDDAEPANGRILVKDHYILDAATGKMESFKREWVSPLSVKANRKYERILKRLNQKNPPSEEEAARFIEKHLSLFSSPIDFKNRGSTRVFFRDNDLFFNNLLKGKNGIDFINGIQDTAQSINPRWRLIQRGDRGWQYTVMPLGSRTEILLTTVVADEQDPKADRVLCHDRYVFLNKNKKLKEFSRYWEALPNTLKNPKYKRWVLALNDSEPPSKEEAKVFLDEVLPDLLNPKKSNRPRSLPVSFKKSIDKMLEGEGGLVIPEGYVSPLAQRFQKAKLTETERVMLLEGLEAMHLIAQERLMKRHAKSQGWWPWSDKVDVNFEKKVIDFLFSQIALRLKESEDRDLFSTLRKLDFSYEGKRDKLSAEEMWIYYAARDLRQKILTDPLLIKLNSANSEFDPQLRGHALMTVAREDLFKKRGLVSSAVYLAENFKEHPKYASDAKDLIAFANGKGSIGAKFEYMGPMFVDHITDPAMLLAMGGAGFVGKTFEYWGLRLFGRIPILGRALSSGAGIVGEAAGFTTLHKVGQSAVQSPGEVWKNWHTETASAALLFGGMRLSHGIVGQIHKKMSQGSFRGIFAKKEKGSWSFRPLNWAGKSTIGVLNFAGGMESMYGAGVLSRWIGLQPQLDQDFGHHQFDAAVMYTQAICGFQLANKATFGALNARLGEMKINLDLYRQQIRKPFDVQRHLPFLGYEPEFLRGLRRGPKESEDPSQRGEGEPSGETGENEGAEWYGVVSEDAPVSETPGRRISGEVESIRAGEEGEEAEWVVESVDPSEGEPDNVEMLGTREPRSEDQRRETDEEDSQGGVVSEPLDFDNGEADKTRPIDLGGLPTAEALVITEMVHDQVMDWASRLLKTNLEKKGSQPNIAKYGYGTFKVDVGLITGMEEYKGVFRELKFQVWHSEKKVRIQENIQQEIEERLDKETDPILKTIDAALLAVHEMDILPWDPGGPRHRAETVHGEFSEDIARTREARRTEEVEPQPDEPPSEPEPEPDPEPQPEPEPKKGRTRAERSKEPTREMTPEEHASVPRSPSRAPIPPEEQISPEPTPTEKKAKGKGHPPGRRFERVADVDQELVEERSADPDDFFDAFNLGWAEPFEEVVKSPVAEKPPSSFPKGTGLILDDAGKDAKPDFAEGTGIPPAPAVPKEVKPDFAEGPFIPGPDVSGKPKSVPAEGSRPSGPLERDDVANLHQKIKNLEAALEAAQNRVKKQYEELMEQLRGRTQALEASRAEEAALRKSLEEQGKDLEELSASVARMSAEKLDGEAKGARILELESELEEARSALEGIQRELEEGRAAWALRIGELESSALQLSQQLETSRNERAELERKHAIDNRLLQEESRKSRRAAEKAAAEVKPLQEVADELSKKVGEQSERISALEKQVQNLEKEKGRLNGELNATKRKLGFEENGREEADRRVVELEHDLNEKGEELRDVRGELEEVREALEALKRELDEAQRQLGERTEEEKRLNRRLQEFEDNEEFKQEKMRKADELRGKLGEANLELDKVKRGVKNLEERITTLAGELASAEEARDGFKTRAENAEAETERLRSDLAGKEAEVEAEGARANQEQSRADQAEGALERKNAELEAAGEEKESLQAQIQALESERDEAIAASEARQDDLENAKVEFEAERERSAQELAQAGRELEEARRLVEEAEAKIRELEGSKLPDLKNKLQEAEKAKANAESELLEKKSKIEAMERERREKFHEHSQEVRRLEGERDEATKRVAELERELEKLKSEFEEKLSGVQHQKEAESIRADQAEVRATELSAQLEELADQAREFVAEIGDIEGELGAERDRTKNAEVKLEEAKRRLKDLEGEDGEFTMAKQEIQNLQEQVREKGAKVASLEGDIRAKERELSNLREELERQGRKAERDLEPLKEGIASLESQIEALKSAKRELESQAEEYEKTIRELRNRLEVLEAEKSAEIVGLTEGIRKQRGTAHEAQMDANRLSLAVTGLTKKLASATIHNTELDQLLAAEKEKVQKLETQLAAAEEALRESPKQIVISKEAMEKAESLNGELQRLRARIRELEKAQPAEAEVESPPPEETPPLSYILRESYDIPLSTDRIFSVGRQSDNDVVIQKHSVSRFHCEIRWNEGHWEVRDAKGTNGTMLRGDDIGGGWYKVPEDGIIEIGGVAGFIEKTHIPNAREFKLRIQSEPDGSKARLSFLSEEQLNELREEGRNKITEPEGAKRKRGFPTDHKVRKPYKAGGEILTWVPASSGESKTVMAHYGEALEQIFGVESSTMASAFASLYKNIRPIIPEIEQVLNPGRLADFDPVRDGSPFGEIDQLLNPNNNPKLATFLARANETVTLIKKSYELALRKGSGVAEFDEEISGDDLIELVTVLDRNRKYTGGRGEGNDFISNDDSVSRQHFSIASEGGDWLITDQNSSNGTFVSGERLQPDSPKKLKDGDLIIAGKFGIVQNFYIEEGGIAYLVPEYEFSCTDTSASFVIGRHSQSDGQLFDPKVSGKHLEFNYDGTVWRVRDLGSQNGTRLNGVPINIPRDPETGKETAGPWKELKGMDEIALGNTVLQFFPITEGGMKLEQRIKATVKKEKK